MSEHDLEEPLRLSGELNSLVHPRQLASLHSLPQVPATVHSRPEGEGLSVGRLSGAMITHLDTPKKTASSKDRLQQHQHQQQQHHQQQQQQQQQHHFPVPSYHRQHQPFVAQLVPCYQLPPQQAYAAVYAARPPPTLSPSADGFSMSRSEDSSREFLVSDDGTLHELVPPNAVLQMPAGPRAVQLTRGGPWSAGSQARAPPCPLHSHRRQSMPQPPALLPLMTQAFVRASDSEEMSPLSTLPTGTTDSSFPDAISIRDSRSQTSLPTPRTPVAPPSRSTVERRYSVESVDSNASLPSAQPFSTLPPHAARPVPVPTARPQAQFPVFDLTRTAKTISQRSSSEKPSTRTAAETPPPLKLKVSVKSRSATRPASAPAVSTSAQTLPQEAATAASAPPVPPPAPVEKKSHKKSHKKKPAAAKHDGQSTKSAHTAASLVNPFARKQSGREDQELADDLNLIKGIEPSDLETADTPGVAMQRRGSVSSVVSSLRNVKDTRGTSPVRPSTRSGGVSETNDATPSHSHYNDDHCSACLGRGQMVCCDTCPRAFHLSCVEEGYDCLEEVPQEESWECRRCRFQKRIKSAKRARRSYGPPAIDLASTPTNIFEPLLFALEGLNARVFQLPREIVENFENVFMHPGTGAYIDTREVEIARPRPKSHRKSEGTAEGRRHMDMAPAAISTTQTCFKCGDTGLKLLSTAFLASHTFPQPEVVCSPQAVRTDLVKCEYCPLLWHLDCLDPPLTCMPPETKEDEKEIVDAGHWNALKLKTWGVEERGGRAEVVPQSASDKKFDSGLIQIRRRWMCPCHVDWSLPKLRVNSGWRWVEVDEDPPAKAAVAESAGKTDGSALRARPAREAAIAGSKRVAESASEVGPISPTGAKKPRTGTGNSHRRKEVVHLDKNTFLAPLATAAPVPVVQSPVKPKPREVVHVSSAANNGDIQIINEPSTNLYYDPPAKMKDEDFEDIESGGVKYRLPERRIRLEFFEKARALPDPIPRSSSPSRSGHRTQRGSIDALAFVDRTFRSNVDELYRDKASAEGTGEAYEVPPARLRATDEEAVEWLESVSKMQSEIASLLQARRNSNSGKPSNGAEPTPAANSDATTETRADTATVAALADTQTSPLAVKPATVAVPRDEYDAFLAWKDAQKRV
ncbi:hypothetical protein HDU87_001852 [Geranomyces variabilis]|uniref:PHD-type domain-containing protein n=1 Tax=Geranomyces variabilis TaxID=109894 RepID=A0AAD5XP72_9FUNG|nr:hypothetical protein HDU87_001852 [Geranomyces variabilis]